MSSNTVEFVLYSGMRIGLLNEAERLKVKLHLLGFVVDLLHNKCTTIHNKSITNRTSGV